MLSVETVTNMTEDEKTICKLVFKRFPSPTPVNIRIYCNKILSIAECRDRIMEDYRKLQTKNINLCEFDPYIESRFF